MANQFAPIRWPGLRQPFFAGSAAPKVLLEVVWTKSRHTSAKASNDLRLEFDWKQPYESLREDNMPGRRKTDAQRKKEGRGQGRGAKFKPWIHPREIPSLGLCTRHFGLKDERTYNFLSLLEWWCALIFAWAVELLDMQEQYPLPIAETLAIAEKLGVRHQAHPRTKKPITVTTDLVITIKCGLREFRFARAIKPAKELRRRRTLDKLEIERQYWASLGVDWGIIVDRDIPEAFAWNVDLVLPFGDLTDILPMGPDELTRAKCIVLEALLQQPDTPLRKITAECDRRPEFVQLSTEGSPSLAIVWHLIAARQIFVDMYDPLDPAKPLRFTRSGPGDSHVTS
jgi:hypothetical protein